MIPYKSPCCQPLTVLETCGLIRKTQYYRFMAENFIGDTIGTWVKVMPRGNQLKFFLDENVYQYQKYSEPKEIVEECFLEAPDSMYFVLSEMKIGKITKRRWMYYSDVTFSFGRVLSVVTGPVAVKILCLFSPI